MFEVYANLFNYLTTHTSSIRRQLGPSANEFAKLLRATDVIAKIDIGDLDELGKTYESYLRKLIRYGLAKPALETYFSEFLEGQGLLHQTAKGVSIRLRPKPSRVEITSDVADEIRNCIRVSEELADALSAYRRARPPFQFEADLDFGDIADVQLKPEFGAPEAPAPAAAPDEAPRPSREITVTGHDTAGKEVKKFADGTEYLLRFRVGKPVDNNLATGNVGVGDLPSGGLHTHWVVASAGVAIIAVNEGGLTPHHPALRAPLLGEEGKGGLWEGRFDLHIPESGASATIEMRVKPQHAPRTLNVVVYDVRPASDNAPEEKQVYREFVVDLESRVMIGADSECVAPRHLHLAETHEWTTPKEHIQVVIVNGLASVTTKRGPTDYGIVELWTGSDNRIAGPIQNVRDAMEKFREKWDSYLNDIDPVDMRMRLNQHSWKPYSNPMAGWHPLPSGVLQPHQDAFDKMKASLELRNLASAGYSLFDSCFPPASQLRGVIEAMDPGSRIDFFWSELSGAGWVSHVPWTLMYMDPPDPLGEQPIDCERFFGLRFRIASRSRSQKASSLALGNPDTTHALHFLYWGDNPADDVGIESRWQGSEYRLWQQQYFVPDAVQPDLKRQIIRALDNPAPSPVGVVYLYCHCSVGDGTKAVLRFGNTSQAADTLKDSELSQRMLADAPLIFANACTTAASDPHLTNLLEDTFFRRGVRAFIGTETKVPIRLASRFAWLFFQFFYRKVDAEPMAAGEALTQARIFLWTQYRNIGGLFYGLVNQYDLFLASSEEVEQLRG
jgi:hypothetical protein